MYFVYYNTARLLCSNAMQSRLNSTAHHLLLSVHIEGWVGKDRLMLLGNGRQNMQLDAVQINCRSERVRQ